MCYTCRQYPRIIDKLGDVTRTVPISSLLWDSEVQDDKAIPSPFDWKWFNTLQTLCDNHMKTFSNTMFFRFLKFSLHI